MFPLKNDSFNKFLKKHSRAVIRIWKLSELSRSQTEDGDELPFMVKHSPSGKFVNTDFATGPAADELPVIILFSQGLLIDFSSKYNS